MVADQQGKLYVFDANRRRTFVIDLALRPQGKGLDPVGERSPWGAAAGAPNRLAWLTPAPRSSGPIGSWLAGAGYRGPRKTPLLALHLLNPEPAL